MPRGGKIKKPERNADDERLEICGIANVLVKRDA